MRSLMLWIQLIEIILETSRPKIFPIELENLKYRRDHLNELFLL